MPTENKIDAAAFEQAFQKARPGYAEKVITKSQEKHAQMGIDFSLTGDIANAAGTFCEWWPKVKSFINMAVSVLGWWPTLVPAAIAAKAFIAAFESMFLPIICGVPPTPVSEPLGGLKTNVSQAARP